MGPAAGGIASGFVTGDDVLQRCQPFKFDLDCFKVEGINHMQMQLLAFCGCQTWPQWSFFRSSVQFPNSLFTGGQM